MSMQRRPVLPPLQTAFTKSQLETLEDEFRRDQYPDIKTRDRLADSLRLNNLIIHIWFQKRRKSPGDIEQSTHPSISIGRPSPSSRSTTQVVPSSPPASFSPGATTSPLMSVEFLSRSSRSPSPFTSSYRVGSLHGTPSSFYASLSHAYTYVSYF